MARGGKKATNGGGGCGKSTKKGGGNKNGEQVSDETTMTMETVDEEQKCNQQQDEAMAVEQGDKEGQVQKETWDVARLLEHKDGNKDDGDGKDNKTAECVDCRTFECNNVARVVWKSNLDPNNEWPMCLICQKAEFGGFPDDYELPADFDHKDRPAEEGSTLAENSNKDEENDESSSKEKDDMDASLPTSGTGSDTEQNKTKEEDGKDDTTDDKDAAMNEEDGDEQEGAEEEPWEMKKIMSIQDVKEDAPVVCKTEGCNTPAAVLYVSTESKQEWHSCLDCQENDFGGWPEHDELPLKHMTDDHKKALITHCSGRMDVEMPQFEGNDKKQQATLSTADQQATAGEDEKEEEDGVEWEMKKVMSIRDVTECPVLCTTEGCNTPAAVLYVSTESPPKKWYFCLTCQENDFGGWPEIDELPLKYMSDEHKKALITHCSNRMDVEMPHFDPAMAPSASPDKLDASNLPASHQTTAAAAITPLPGQSATASCTTLADPAAQQLNGVAGGGGGSKVTPAERPKKPAAKPSKKVLETHRKWQEAAEAMGGKDARIVVSKPAAKKLIFDLLHDEFAPLNITVIHKKLKAVVPSPVLKDCLSDMALDKGSDNMFADSDDEDDKPASKSKAKPSNADPYDGSLCLKAGKSAGGSLYYVDHTKLKNNGDGLEPDEKNELYSEAAKAQAEKDALQAGIKEKKSMTAKLLSEPTNEEAIALLEKGEKALSELRAEVEDSRKLKENEKYKGQLKRRSERMAAEWRKRRRICMDFLVTLEEMTDGTVSAKKCLAGDGQIELDSDEAIAKSAAEYAKKKKAKAAAGGRTSMMGKRARSGGIGGNKKAASARGGTDSASLADENFVAVTLDSQGCVKRVYLDEKDN